MHGNESQMSILAPLFCLTGKANCVGGAFSLTQLESVQWLHAGVASVPLVINASKMVPGASKNLMKQLFGLIKDVLEKSTRVIVLEHKQFSYKAKTFTETFTVNTLNGDVYCPRWVLVRTMLSNQPDQSLANMSDHARRLPRVYTTARARKTFTRTCPDRLRMQVS